MELIDFYLHKIEFYFSKKQQEDDEPIEDQDANIKKAGLDDSDEEDEDGIGEEQKMSSI